MWRTLRLPGRSLILCARIHEDPPRIRANKIQGHGTWDKDRPPVLGIVGRESGQIRLSVLHNTAWQDQNPLLMQATKPGTTVNTDDWAGYLPLSVNERIHVTVCHSKKNPVWARDLDGDRTIRPDLTAKKVWHLKMIALSISYISLGILYDHLIPLRIWLSRSG